MTKEQRDILVDAMDKQEDMLVDLCVNKGVGWDDEKYKDALIFLSRECRMLAIEVIRLSEAYDGVVRRIEDLETEMRMAIRG